jgi:hypothetical protein
MPLGVPSRRRSCLWPAVESPLSSPFHRRSSLDRAFRTVLIAVAIGSRRTGTEIGPFTNKAG